MFGLAIKIKSTSTRRNAAKATALASLLSLCLFLSQTSEARFSYLDADEIDREDVLTSEYINDELSYRMPYHWDQWWLSSSNGGMFNAGSYNKTDLMYLESLKLSSSEARAATFKFVVEKEERLVQNSSSQAFEVQLNSFRPILVSLLADTDSRKEYGDGGIALAVSPRRDRLLRLYAWSVDHFYNDKKPFTEDRYDKRIYTYGILYNWRFSRKWRLFYQFELDTPLVWQRLSEQYTYEYQKDVHRLRTDWGRLDRGLLLSLRATIENKTEKKDWLDDELNFKRRKTLKRSSSEIEGLANYVLRAKENLTLGVVFIGRKSDYEWREQVKTTLKSTDEKPTFDIERNEVGGYLTYMHHPFTNYKLHGLQYGLYINDVRIKEETEKFSKVETKAQIGWAYQFDEKVAAFVNSTWDLDQIADDYPFKENAFSPWGGGNLQFIAMF